MYILGISAFYHDSAATILIDGKIIAAAQEERFTRKKHDLSYPFNAIEFVLNFAKTKLSETEHFSAFIIGSFTLMLLGILLFTFSKSHFSFNSIYSKF